MREGGERDREGGGERQRGGTRERDSLLTRNNIYSWYTQLYMNVYIPILVNNNMLLFQSEPPRKTCIRAISYITGFVIMPLSQQSCEVTYITQSDPKGMSTQH